MEMTDFLVEARDEWNSETTPEFIRFETFKDPLALRAQNCQRSMASLNFGGYPDIDDPWCNIPDYQL
jgi:hypothetical protein